jgi:hypothetical protein
MPSRKGKFCAHRNRPAIAIRKVTNTPRISAEDDPLQKAIKSRQSNQDDSLTRGANFPSMFSENSYKTQKLKKIAFLAEDQIPRRTRFYFCDRVLG